MSKRLTIGGRVWVCETPGKWVSEDRRYVAHRVMQGTSLDSWEIYRTRDEFGRLLMNDMRFKLAAEYLTASLAEKIRKVNERRALMRSVRNNYR